MTGRVLGEGNEPRVGTTVAALFLQYLQGQQRLAISSVALTNDLGDYRLFGLKPQRYYIAAFEPNRHGPVRFPKGAPPEERYGISFYPNAIDATKSTTINVQPGSELNGADIYLARHRTFHLRGRVITGGRGAQNLRVQLKPLLSGTAITMDGQDSTPDDSGVFEFSGLLPGQYLISAMFMLAGKGYRAWQPIEIQDSDTSNVIITPSAGINVQGRLQLTEHKEADLRSVTLNFHPTYSFLEGIPSARPSFDGTFAAYVNADIYDLEISHLPEDFYVESVRIFDQESADRVIDFSRFPNSWTRLDITLNPNGGRIDGTVDTDKQEPVSGATVLLVPQTTFRKQAELFRTVNTDKSGRFSIRGIVPGEYKLLAWEDVETGAWEDPEFLNGYENRGEKMTVKPNSSEARNLAVIPAAVEQ